VLPRSNLRPTRACDLPEPIVHRLIVSNAFKPDGRERVDATLPLVSLYDRREPLLAAENIDRTVVLLSPILNGDAVLWDGYTSPLLEVIAIFSDCNAANEEFSPR
jgi:hypothetical protein